MVRLSPCCFSASASVATAIRAEERLAAFLLNLWQRFTAQGFSHAEFYMRMTREEIGSYLDLKALTNPRLTGYVAIGEKSPTLHTP